MRNFFAGLTACLLLLLSSLDVYAHFAGQPPFFKVNGTYSPLYPVPSSSLTDFLLPQDQGPANYFVEEPIEFEIDPTQLAVPLDVFEQTKFTWNFGDGTTGLGNKITHTYKKPGSYLLKIDAAYKDISGAQLFQSIMLNVLPKEGYELPKALITINGKTPSDPLVDFVNIAYGQNVTFEAGNSSGGDSKIVSYFWDFGDGQSAKGEKVTHTYDKNLTKQQVFPLLRVRTTDGFIADTFAEIDNKGERVSRVSRVSKVSSAGQLVWVVMGVGVVIVVGGVWILRKKKRRKS